MTEVKNDLSSSLADRVDHTPRHHSVDHDDVVDDHDGHDDPADETVVDEVVVHTLALDVEDRSPVAENSVAGTHVMVVRIHAGVAPMPVHVSSHVEAVEHLRFHISFD